MPPRIRAHTVESSQRRAQEWRQQIYEGMFAPPFPYWCTLMNTMCNQNKAEEDSDIEILDSPPPTRSASAPGSTNSAGKHGKWTTNDLPPGAQDDDRWSMVFVPTLLRYQGCRHDPWNWDQLTNVNIVQKVWDQVYGDSLVHKVQLNDCVHTVVRSFDHVSLFADLSLSLTVFHCPRPPSVSTTGEADSLLPQCRCLRTASTQVRARALFESSPSRTKPMIR